MDWTLFISFLSAVMSGVLMRILFEQFDEKYRKPVRNILELRRQIISALTMYAYMYTNPGVELNPEEATRKSNASWDIRHLAAELDGAIAAFYDPDMSQKGWKLLLEKARQRTVNRVGRAIPTLGALRTVSSHLIGLSNRFYDTRVIRGRDAVERNDETANKIRELLTRRIDNPIELAKYQ